MLIRIPYKDENKEKLKELCWTAYKTSRIVFARDGECSPVLMCEVNLSPDGKKKTSTIVCNVPMDEKRLAVSYLKERFKVLQPIRFAFVSEAYMTKVIPGSTKREKQETLICQGSDKFGNMYFIRTEIVKQKDEIKKLGTEEADFADNGQTLWDGIF